MSEVQGQRDPCHLDRKYISRQPLIKRFIKGFPTYIISVYAGYDKVNEVKLSIWMGTQGRFSPKQGLRQRRKSAWLRSLTWAMAAGFHQGLPRSIENGSQTHPLKDRWWKHLPIRLPPKTGTLKFFQATFACALLRRRRLCEEGRKMLGEHYESNMRSLSWYPM